MRKLRRPAEVKLSDPIMKGVITPPDFSDIESHYLATELELRGLLVKGRPIDWFACKKCGRYIRSAQKRYSCESRHLPPGGEKELWAMSRPDLNKKEKLRAQDKAKKSAEARKLEEARRLLAEERKALAAEREKLAEERKVFEETRRLGKGKRVYSILAPRGRNISAPTAEKSPTPSPESSENPPV